MVTYQCAAAGWLLDPLRGGATIGPEQSPRLSSEAAALSPSELTILLVEDDPAVRELLARVLRRAGFSVIEAVDGVDALERWHEYGGPVALLLTDVVMPRLAGPELVHCLRQERPALRVLYISGFTFGAPLQEAAAFMAKPLHPAALVKRVKELVGLC